MIPGAEEAFKIIVLTFVCFMHYVATGLVFFVPIDVGYYILGMPKFVAILFGSFCLWVWAFITAWVIIKKVKQ